MYYSQHYRQPWLDVFVGFHCSSLGQHREIPGGMCSRYIWGPPSLEKPVSYKKSRSKYASEEDIITLVRKHIYLLFPKETPYIFQDSFWYKHPWNDSLGQKLSQAEQKHQKIVTHPWTTHNMGCSVWQITILTFLFVLVLVGAPIYSDFAPTLGIICVFASFKAAFETQYLYLI